MAWDSALLVGLPVIESPARSARSRTDSFVPDRTGCKRKGRPEAALFVICLPARLIAAGGGHQVGLRFDHFDRLELGRGLVDRDRADVRVTGVGDGEVTRDPVRDLEPV